MKKIFILATLDTKFEEVEYLKKEIEANDCSAVIVDCSLRQHNLCCADISQANVLGRLFISEEEFNGYTKERATAVMQEAITNLLIDMHKSGELKGVIAVGGVQGTFIATKAMQELDVGVPKMVVSTVANGNNTFGPFVGISDMTIMHSVVDIAGMNHILKRILRNAAGAICGMVGVKALEPETDKIVGITMAGVTTEGITRIIKKLHMHGFETMIFHCNGIGAQIMEKLVKEGVIKYVLDISPHDIMDGLQNGLMPCYSDRLIPIAEEGIPLVFVPGSADFILYNGVLNVPEDKRNRNYVEHNLIHTHVRADRKEMRELGIFIAKRLNNTKGKVKILFPKYGLSQMNKEGKPLYDPEADKGFLDAIYQNKGEKIEIIEVDSHINDEIFADLCVTELLSMC